MRLLLLGLLTLLFAIMIGSLVGSDTDQVIMRISGWTIQTTATLFVIVLFFGFLGTYFTVRSLVRFFEIPKEIKAWRQHRRAEKYLTRGLINLTEGHWKRAERDFCKAAPYSRAAYVNYLLAARASQELHAVDRRDEYLRLAYYHNLDGSLSVGLTQAELQLRERQIEQALATLKCLQKKKPNQNQVKKLLLETYTKLSDWQSILNIISSIEKTNLFTHEELQEKKLGAYAGLLEEAGNRKDKDMLNTIWTNTPHKLKQYSELIYIYVAERLKLDDAADCEILLKKALKCQWDDSLVRLYGFVVASDLVKQQATAESWLNNHARSAVLLLTLGRICKRGQLWGKARDYLQESIDVQVNPEAYYEFAGLYEKNENRGTATELYEKGLKLAMEISNKN